jgi:hypothetical protein
VCNAKELAERWSYKKMAAQNVKDLGNSKFSLKNQFLLVITFEPWFYELCDDALERS